MKRRDVLKSTAGAIGGIGGAAAIANPAAARCNTVGEVFSWNGIELGVEVKFCSGYIEYTIDHPLQSTTCRIGRDSDCDGELNLGAATLEYSIGGDVDEQEAEATMELCIWHLTGWSCYERTVEASPDGVDI
ncbi:hypothetical protein [Halorhabdus sp. SVX81]|uniref:hypothetical protein n=1 Tax=Halorhabdus sp. SVX81 TaxID=2978283 RepID=UPI0023DB6612|nr:hypothetical protein [Halorhabdus sp. SVX81]